MAAAYSTDLRARVIKDADGGLTSKALAERYHVSRAWMRRQSLNLVDLPEAIGRLHETTFHGSPDLLQWLMNRDAKRRKG